MLHDACSTLAADHTFVHGVIAVAFDKFNRSIFEIDLNAATTRTHVTCCGFDLVPGFGRQIDNGLIHLFPLVV